MVGSADRFERKGENLGQGFVRWASPVMANENAEAILSEVPNAPPVKVFFSFQGIPMRVSRLSDPQYPVQRDLCAECQAITLARQ